MKNANEQEQEMRRFLDEHGLVGDTVRTHSHTSESVIPIKLADGRLTRLIETASASVFLVHKYGVDCEQVAADAVAVGFDAELFYHNGRPSSLHLTTEGMVFDGEARFSRRGEVPEGVQRV